MNIPLPTMRREIPSVCRMLRTKNAFTTQSDDDANATPWQLGESPTAVYWCLATMQHAGPDDSYAHPHVCMAGRTCFRSTQE